MAVLRAVRQVGSNTRARPRAEGNCTPIAPGDVEFIGREQGFKDSVK